MIGPDNQSFVIAILVCVQGPITSPMVTPICMMIPNNIKILLHTVMNKMWITILGSSIG